MKFIKEISWVVFCFIFIFIFLGLSNYLHRKLNVRLNTIKQMEQNKRIHDYNEFFELVR